MIRELRGFPRIGPSRGRGGDKGAYPTDIPPVSRFLNILFVFSVLCGSASAALPNIVFIMSDDHAYEAVSCYGSWLKDDVVTPNIDRLAKEGMRFTNFACNNSICSPSRASFLSGQYSHKNGCTGLNGAIRKDAPIFASELGKAGYQTALFGKWHLKNVPDYFQTYKVVKGQGKYFDPTFLTRKGTEKKTGYSSDVYTDEALSWLKAHDEKKPFLLCLQFKAPHHDYSYAKRHDNFLEGHTFPEPATLHEDVTKTSALLKNPYWAHMSRNRAYYGRHWKDNKPPMRPVTDHKDTRAVTSAAYQHMMLKYARCVAGVDENVGRVLKYLDDQQLSEDTIVIYTSDQGYWLGQHGFYDKRLILDTSLKMPFVVRFPGHIKAGTLNENLCANVDLAPTLLDYAGIEIPKTMQGRSLRPLLEGTSADDWREALWYCYWGGAPNHWGVRTDRYTLVKFPGTDEIEFYDNEKDPDQTRNIAQEADYASSIRVCEAQLARLMKEVDILPAELPKKATSKHPAGPWTPEQGNPDDQKRPKRKPARK